jgi:murein L,D-transpeptidase YafK
MPIFTVIKPYCIALLLILLPSLCLWAQPSGSNYPSWPDNSFYESQMAGARVRSAVNKYDTEWAKLFKEKGLNFPKTQIYLRNFKQDQKLEVYARNTSADTFVLLKTFNVCVLSGNLGPKRKEGDLQVPEGFYFIDEFNANSNYYLSLLVSYPNYADLIKGDKEAPGGAIYIHGSCVTVGCVPMTDEIISEIYALCVIARTNGQYNIPVHVFPTYFTRQGLNVLGKYYSKNDLKAFWITLKKQYDYFQTNKKILPVLYDNEGNYVY